MSLGVQNEQTSTIFMEIALANAEGEQQTEKENGQQRDISDSQGALNTHSKQYTLKPQTTNTHLSNQVQNELKIFQMAQGQQQESRIADKFLDSFMPKQPQNAPNKHSSTPQPFRKKYLSTLYYPLL